MATDCLDIGHGGIFGRHVRAIFHVLIEHGENHHVFFVEACLTRFISLLPLQ